MYSLKNLFKNEPAVIAGAGMSVVNVLALFDVIHATVQQLGAVNVATIAVLTLFTRSKVTPV